MREAIERGGRRFSQDEITKRAQEAVTFARDNATEREAVTDMRKLGSLQFDNYNVEAHQHRHHVFSGTGHGAELEFARGCPWACSFCNKTLFRNKFRERNVDAVIEEVDRLIARGVDYIYWIDEIFGVGKNVLRLLEELSHRPISIGLQTRVDLWNEETLDLLGRARCISMECGIESITEQGRDELNRLLRLGVPQFNPPGVKRLTSE